MCECGGEKNSSSSEKGKGLKNKRRGENTKHSPIGAHVTFSRDGRAVESQFIDQISLVDHEHLCLLFSVENASTLLMWKTTASSPSFSRILARISLSLSPNPKEGSESVKIENQEGFIDPESHNACAPICAALLLMWEKRALTSTDSCDCQKHGFKCCDFAPTKNDKIIHVFPSNTSFTLL